MCLATSAWSLDKNSLASGIVFQKCSFLKSRCITTWRRPMVSETRRPAAIKRAARRAGHLYAKAQTETRIAALTPLILSWDNAASEVSERRQQGGRSCPSDRSHGLYFGGFIFFLSFIEKKNNLFCLLKKHTVNKGIFVGHVL